MRTPFIGSEALAAGVLAPYWFLSHKRQNALLLAASYGLKEPPEPRLQTDPRQDILWAGDG